MNELIRKYGIIVVSEFHGFREIRTKPDDIYEKFIQHDMDQVNQKKSKGGIYIGSLYPFDVLYILGDFNIGRKKVLDILIDNKSTICVANIKGTFKKNNNQLDHELSNCANVYKFRKDLDPFGSDHFPISGPIGIM